MIIWTSFVKIWIVCWGKFKANFLFFSLFDLETIIWWLVFEKKAKSIQVLAILLQL